VGHTADATGQQGVLTHPRHLIPSPVFPGVRVSPFLYLTFNSYLNLETDYSSVSWSFHTPYAGDSGMLLQVYEKLTMANENTKETTENNYFMVICTK
jgi:hypothetical protein